MTGRLRRFRIWLGRKILPSGVVTMDMGPMFASFAKIGKALRDAELVYDSRPLLEDGRLTDTREEDSA